MRRGVRSEQASEPFRPWKPEVCEEPGCDARHPSYSRDGMAGPWRCRKHDLTATRKQDGLM